MRWRFRSLFFLLLLFPLAFSWRVAIAQQGGSLDLASPRATFDSFLSAMNDVKQGRTGRLNDAVACLDLSDVLPVVRSEAGPKLARDLKNYLDKVERIDMETIPVQVDGSRWVYQRTRDGEVSVVRTEDGRWLFSPQTFDSLPALLESVQGRSFAPGIQGGGGAGLTFSDWLRNRLPEALLSRVFILETWQWLALFVLAFVGVVVDRTVRLVLGTWLAKLLIKSESIRDKKFEVDFERPVGILSMGVTWLLLLPVLDLPLAALAALKLAAQLVIAGGSVWAAYRLIDLLAAHFMALTESTDTKIDDILVPMVSRALKIVTIAFGLLFVAQNLNIDITSLLAGLGLGGLAFALAAKDTVANLFGSLTVLIDRPFQIGDWIVIGDHEGTVEEIGFRSTRIRTFYNSKITVPNSNLVNIPVDNLGMRRFRRVKCMISIEYDTPPEKIEAFCEGIRELIRRHPYTRKDYYMVYFNEFADSALNILLYAFHITPDWPTELRERHRLFVDIVRLAKRLHIGFAFPTRTLHLASVPPTLSHLRPDTPTKVSDVPIEDGPSAAPLGNPVQLGRSEAEAILQGLGPDPQPPVDFQDPDRVRPGS